MTHIPRPLPKNILIRLPLRHACSEREIKLETPVRDKIEKWFNPPLSLNTTIIPMPMHQGCPHPSTCELFYVGRNTPISCHPASEVFLQHMMALYVTKSTERPPTHVRCAGAPPLRSPLIKDDECHLPEPLVVLQVAIMDGFNRGVRSGCDTIPWLVIQQFQEDKFGLLSRERVVGIATRTD